MINSDIVTLVYTSLALRENVLALEVHIERSNI